jgi:hypothetical protein
LIAFPEGSGFLGGHLGGIFFVVGRVLGELHLRQSKEVGSFAASVN